MISRHRRYDNDRQLELCGDWTPKRCQSQHHQGNPEVPADQFVRNGAYRRTVCRLCWATQNRGKRYGDSSIEQRDRDLDALLHRLWRPVVTTSANDDHAHAGRPGRSRWRR